MTERAEPANDADHITRRDTRHDTRHDKVRADVAIVGGGVCGLWVRAALAHMGLGTALIERDQLGSGQTISSQGILHAGVKYALGGERTRASLSAQAVQPEWTACLDSERAPDLSGVDVLTRTMTLWTTGDMRSKVAAAGAARAMRSQVIESQTHTLSIDPSTHAFTDAPASIKRYCVDERVIDPQSLVRSLARASADPMLVRTTIGSIERTPASDTGSTWRIDVASPDQTGVYQRHIYARYLVLAAGAGNAALLDLAHVAMRSSMQRRPLHMVFVRNVPCELYGHCIRLATTPRLTITTHTSEDGQRVWSVGGQIAELGVKRTPAEQIDAARKELVACLPWLDLSKCQFSSSRIDRAEGLTPSGARPDGPVIHHADEVSVVWPTKLVLAPVAAQEVADTIERSLQITPKPVSVARRSDDDTLSCSPSVAPFPWNTEGVTWT